MSPDRAALWADLLAELRKAQNALEGALSIFERLNPKRETNGIEAYNLIEFKAYDALCSAIEKIREGAE